MYVFMYVLLYYNTVFSLSLSQYSDTCQITAKQGLLRNIHVHTKL